MSLSYYACDSLQCAHKSELIVIAALYLHNRCKGMLRKLLEKD